MAIAIIALSAMPAMTCAQGSEAPQSKATVVADSIRSKGTRIGKKVAEGTAVVVDSAGSKGTRIGKKAVVVADTIAHRSKKAWKAMKGE